MLLEYYDTKMCHAVEYSLSIGFYTIKSLIDVVGLGWMLQCNGLVGKLWFIWCCDNQLCDKINCFKAEVCAGEG